jgi:hypothetical protein
VGLSRWKSYQGIQAYVGPMGSGKTYLMTRSAVAALRQGREVWANAGYAVTDPQSGRSTKMYVSLQEMLLAPAGSLLLLDEAGTFMNARHYQELPRGLMYRLTQARKSALQLIYTAQHEMQVDVALRRLTSRVHYVSRIGPVGVSTAWPPVDFCKADTQSLGRQWFMLRKKVMEAYDSTARVWVPPEILEQLQADTPKWLPLTDELIDAVVRRLDEARSNALASVTPSPAPKKLPPARGRG